jgi:lipoprotein-anchoring transpeptidase ErfK/SrfK
MAILTAAGTIGATSSADAALYYWQDSEPGFSRPAPPPQPRRQRVRKHSGKTEAAEKETSAKPQGPLIIAISIDRQKVRVYDANGFFAESPVSTGMKGHPTPMGVFSIIQKHKLHHSNIYSGAPMPFMQRITWSGVAMHAGVLPGYPASHGCIRMPMAFAVKMWNWTKMGARVIVTPGEMSPANFSHPLLVAEKIVPQPVIANEPKTDAPAIKSDKGADAGSAIKPANSVADLELRPTVGHALSMQTRTADAGGAANAAVTISDAAPSLSSEASVGAEAKSEAAKSEPVKSEAEATPANSIAAASSDNKAAEATSLETKSPETANGIEPKTEQAESVEAKPEEVQTGTLKADAAKIDAPKAAEKDTLKAAENPAKPPAETPAVAPDAKKDCSRLPGAEKTAAAKAEPPKRTGQISVFVSRKDGKLYVRQNFSPLFEVPVTIAPSERMLGTHVFTAETDKNDPNKLRWSVVTLPVTARNAAPSDDDERSTRRRKVAGGAPAMVKSMPAPDSAAEALDRITIPSDAMARIAEALTTGSSIVVSDQGINQGETGEGTDFIVSLR